jgi:hypothetical protein
MRVWAIVFASLSLAWAGAWSLPADAQVFLTAADGTIVGIGTSSGGTTFELDLLDGFEGEARLLVVGGDVDPQVLDVLVLGGVVYVGDVDLAVTVRSAGFVDVSIGASDPPAASNRPAAPPGNDVADQVRGDPGDANEPRERAREGVPGPNENANERAEDRGEGPADERANEAADDAPRNDDARDEAPNDRSPPDAAPARP